MLELNTAVESKFPRIVWYIAYFHLCVVRYIAYFHLCVVRYIAYFHLGVVRYIAYFHLGAGASAGMTPSHTRKPSGHISSPKRPFLNPSYQFVGWQEENSSPILAGFSSSVSLREVYITPESLLSVYHELRTF